MANTIFITFAKRLLMKISDDVENQIIANNNEIYDLAEQIEDIYETKIVDFNKEYEIMNMIASIETIYTYLLNPSFSITNRLDILDENRLLTQSQLDGMNFSEDEKKNIIQLSLLIKKILNLMIKSRNHSDRVIKKKFSEEYYPILFEQSRNTRLIKQRLQRGGHLYNKKLNIIYLTKQL